MKAEDIAQRAAQLVSGDRERTHGDKAVNFANIARLWNAWLQNQYPDWPTPFIEPHHVAELMALLKIARMSSGGFNLDDATDACGYAAIAGELAERASAVRPERAGELAAPGEGGRQ